MCFPTISILPGTKKPAAGSPAAAPRETSAAAAWRRRPSTSPGRCPGSDESVDRQAITENLTKQRLELLAQRTMQELRRTANIDIRI